MTPVTVTRRGQTTIPVELRKKYDIEEGTALEVEGTGSGILLKKAKSTLDLVGTGRRPQKEIFTLLDKMRERKMSARRLAKQGPVKRSYPWNLNC